MNTNRNQISLAGEFAVLSQLAARGFDASLTLGYTKSVDILVSDPVSGRMFKIEVKTAPFRTSKAGFYGEGRFYYWIMGKKHEQIFDNDLYYVFVLMDEHFQFKYFVVPSKKVADYVQKEHAYWLSTESNKPRNETDMRHFRIGIEDAAQYNLSTLQASECEDNWDILRTN